MGPGGMGKTRLAARFIGMQKSPSSWCDLTEARTQDDVVATLAAALGSPLATAISDPVTHVGKLLSTGGRRFIVLDNFEQIVSCAPATVGAWLRLAPDVCFL